MHLIHAQRVGPFIHAQSVSEACLAKISVAVLPKVVLQPWVVLRCTLITTVTTLEYSSSGTFCYTCTALS